MPKGQSLHHEQDLYQYMLDHSIRKPAVMDALMEDTQMTDYPAMATADEQGQFLSFLVKSIGAKKILEIGVFTGVGTLWMAEGMGDKGHIVACDTSESYTSIAKKHWKNAGVDHLIELRLAPALQTLQELLDDGQEESFDFCYVDAVKMEYDQYYELGFQLMKPGGIIAFDNMFLGGSVIDAEAQGEPVRVIREMNEKLHGDSRVDVSFLSIGDGLHLVRKK